MTKKNSVHALLLLVLVVALSFVLAGCSNNDNDNEAEEDNAGESITLMISIEYPNKAKTPDIENFKFKAEEDTTVLEATALYCSTADIECLVNTTENQVVGLNNVHNGELKKNYVWKFLVNGKTVTKDPLEYELKDGDNISWYYTKK